MRDLFYNIKNSQYLSLAKLLELKVWLVLLFMVIFVIFIVPISLIQETTWTILILLPTLFIVLLLSTVTALILKQSRLAMHLSIYAFFSLNIYYISGSGEIYGYLIVFVTLIVIIFFQDIYAYIIYGGALTLYGFYYIQVHGPLLVTENQTDLALSNSMYQSILGSFFLIFLIYFILSDSAYDRINKRYKLIEAATSLHKKYFSKFLSEMKEKEGEKELHEMSKMQQAIHELTTFTSKVHGEKGTSISELVEFYFSLHEYDIEEVLNSGKLTKKASNYAKDLDRYRLDEGSHLYNVLYDFSTQFEDNKGIERYNYETNIDSLFETRANKIIALAFLYKHLRTEPTQVDKWGRLEKTLSHKEICNLFQTKEFREYLTFEDIQFFMNHQKTFDTYLS